MDEFKSKWIILIRLVLISVSNIGLIKFFVRLSHVIIF